MRVQRQPMDETIDGEGSKTIDKDGKEKTVTNVSRPAPCFYARLMVYTLRYMVPSNDFKENSYMVPSNDFRG